MSLNLWLLDGWNKSQKQSYQIMVKNGDEYHDRK